jgi:hypothetical protein
MNTDEDPNLEYQEGFVFDLVFGGENWSNTTIALAPDRQSFVAQDASESGVNDFAQAADDARAVILFMHEYDAFEIA